MTGIAKKNEKAPDDVLEMKHGRSHLFHFGDEEAWWSELLPGWNWDEDLEPYAEGAKSCPMTHREYVVSGQIRYLMEDGTEVVASAGDLLFIEPGHRGWVVGDEPCIVVDW